MRWNADDAYRRDDEREICRHVIAHRPDASVDHVLAGTGRLVAEYASKDEEDYEWQRQGEDHGERFSQEEFELYPRETERAQLRSPR